LGSQESEIRSRNALWASVTGVGIFTFLSLPMRENGQMPLEANQRRAAEPGAVLIVEDSENSADLLEIALLGIPGIAVLLASSAFEALRILDGPNAPVRAIVTDLNMPRMDGFELIRRVRGDARLSATPIIVVSADTDPATPQRIADLGVDAFFPKPFSPTQVRRKLEQILDGATQ
jgi:CheY-like chemotaxis protein